MEDDEVKEILREEFFRDWLENASKQEIIEKLIQNDERAKQINELEWKNEIFVKSIKSHKETIKKLQIENIGYQLSQLPDTSEDYKMLRKQLQQLLED